VAAGAAQEWPPCSAAWAAGRRPAQRRPGRHAWRHRSHICRAPRWRGIREAFGQGLGGAGGEGLVGGVLSHSRRVRQTGRRFDGSCPCFACFSARDSTQVVARPAVFVLEAFVAAWRRARAPGGWQPGRLVPLPCGAPLLHSGSVPRAGHAAADWRGNTCFALRHIAARHHPGVVVVCGRGAPVHMPGPGSGRAGERRAASLP